MSNQTKLMTVKEAIITAMSEEMRRDENVFLIGEDVGIFGGDFGTSVGMLEEFGSERIKDTPIFRIGNFRNSNRSCHDRIKTNC